MHNCIVPFPISSYRVDCRKILKPYAFMAMAQDVANQNASEQGYGYSHLLTQNITWVLSRMKAEYVNPPRFQQDTVIETWQKGMKGPFSIRDFEVRDADTSELLVRCTTSWLLINLDTRNLVRMDRIIGPQLEATAIMKDAISEPAGKIRPSSNVTYTSSYTVKFSDIDYNHHVNNAKYMEWALDTIGDDLAMNHDIESWQITFNHEARFGETVDFYVGQISSTGRYVECRRGDETIFQINVIFKP